DSPVNPKVKTSGTSPLARQSSMQASRLHHDKSRWRPWSLLPTPRSGCNNCRRIHSHSCPLEVEKAGSNSQLYWDLRQLVLTAKRLARGLHSSLLTTRTTHRV